jgi:hypothetical protein
MARWEDDDFWDDLEPDPDSQVPVESELEGCVYMVPDRVWGFEAPDREDHPGACVECALIARLTFLNKGTDVRSARTDRYLVVIVEPSTQNKLQKTTAFALDPRRIRLHVLLNLHRSSRLLGQLEEVYFRPMREQFEALTGRGAE